MYCLLGRYQLKQKIGYVLEGKAMPFLEADRKNKINGRSMKYQNKDKVMFFIYIHRILNKF